MNTFKYPRQNRVRKRKDFLECYNCGKKFHSRGFLLFALETPGEPQRAGVSVSRKVGNAVARNRVKRLLREFFRLRAFVLPETRLVAVAKKTAVGLGLSEVESELAPIIRRLQKERNANGFQN